MKNTTHCYHHDCYCSYIGCCICYGIWDIFFCSKNKYFSFAVRTNTIHSQSITTANATHTKTVSSQITTKNPVTHNATTLTSGTGACSNTDNYLWNHAHGKTDHNTPPNYRFHDYGQCITVTGTVYSSGGTTQEPDGDLHFTLQLDPQYEQYSNRYDPPCVPHPAGSPACKNIIVEVICHNAINPSYIKEFGNYCKGVHSVFQGMPFFSTREI
jgi:hypothetical protein